MLHQLPPELYLQPSSPWARSSYYCGLAGFLLGPLAGIPALILGHMALAKIKKRGDCKRDINMAWLGLIFGYFTTFVLTALVAFVIAGIRRSQDLSLALTTLDDAFLIEKAFESFYLDYGSFPVKGELDASFDFLNDARDFDMLLGSTARVSVKSPRYLTVRTARKGKGGIVYDPSGKKILGIFDSWGQPLRVRLDLDLDGVIEVKERVYSGRKSVVWSDGPDRMPGTGDDVMPR